MNQIELIADIVSAIGRQGMENMNIRQYNTVIRVADELIREMTRETVAATPGMGLYRWLESDDTGMSSRYMAYRLWGDEHRMEAFPFAEPADPADFGRCHRLAIAVPGTALRLRKIADASPMWGEIAARFNELSIAYESDWQSTQGGIPSHKCWTLMSEMQKRVKERFSNGGERHG
jgi:hypothetical protein